MDEKQQEEVGTAVDPQRVIEELGRQLGDAHVQIAMLRVALSQRKG